MTPLQKVLQMLDDMVAKGKKEKHEEEVLFGCSLLYGVIGGPAGLRRTEVAVAWSGYGCGASTWCCGRRGPVERSAPGAGTSWPWHMRCSAGQVHRRVSSRSQAVGDQALIRPTRAKGKGALGEGRGCPTFA